MAACVCVFIRRTSTMQLNLFICINTERAHTSCCFCLVLLCFKVISWSPPRFCIFLLNNSALPRGAPRAIIYVYISQCIIASDKKYTHARAHSYIYTERRICASCLYLSLSLSHSCQHQIAAQKIVSNGFRFFPNSRNDLFVLTDLLWRDAAPKPQRLNCAELVIFI